MMRFIILLLCASAMLWAEPRPLLVITRADADAMRQAVGRYPSFDSTFSEARELLQRALASPIDIPRPVDAGGVTHEKHKQNYTEMQTAGVLFAVTGEERYAHFVRDMLLQYARMYPTLPTHPKAISDESAGRLFWQTLNETVWLVHAAQAYDCIYNWLSSTDRQTLEANLFRPMVRFLTVDHAREFNRVHNHGTWMVAAVGMTGYALSDSGLVAMALYGTNRDGRGGFLQQLNLLFSPDGYYTEGPYYTRYALMPFFLFAEAIEHNQPSLHIFEYRTHILKKALLAALQQTTPSGTFLPLNDALKEMSVDAKEMVVALDVTYARFPEHAGLLSIASRQGRVMLSGAGLRVAQALSTVRPLPEFPLSSIEFRDGADGTQGGLGILRSGTGKEQTLLVMKYAAQGMGHGHFDRCGIVLYDQGREILSDYGSARFINVEQKFGGRYLPENTSWAKQTIAHNTITVDGRSQFGGKTDEGEKHPGERRFFDSHDPHLQVMSAMARDVAPGVTLQRTVAMVRDTGFSRPVVVDIVRAVSPQQHQYDLPFYYQGQMLSTTAQLRVFDSVRTAFGTTAGYQHLWHEAEGRAERSVQWSWLLGGSYYSVTSATDSTTTVHCVQIGAGDPLFNLRNEPGVILRRRGASTVFASVIEPHGVFEPVDEISRESLPQVSEVTVLASSEEGTVVQIDAKSSRRLVLCLADSTGSPDRQHLLRAGDREYVWKGNYHLLREWGKKQ